MFLLVVVQLIYSLVLSIEHEHKLLALSWAIDDETNEWSTINVCHCFFFACPN